MVLKQKLDAIRFSRLLMITAIIFVLSMFSINNTQAADAVDVSVTRQSNTITATYILNAPVREFTFHEILIEDGPASKGGDILRDGTWQILTPNMSLNMGTIRRHDGAEFDQFNLQITADTEEYGRVYPALVPLGEGVVIGAEYLAGARTQMATTITFMSSQGDIIVAGEQPPASSLGIIINRAYDYSTLDTDEYVVFIGPENYFIDGNVRAVIDPATPDWLSAAVIEEAEESIAYYTQKLSKAIPSRPTFLITYIPEGFRAGWRGDVSAAGLVSMRLRGRGWARPSRRLEQELALFVAHEVNHFWNGRLYLPEAGNANAWLHEGAAEYMALKSLHERQKLSDSDLDFLLLRSANRCLKDLNEATSDSTISNDGIYECGTFAQWIAEAALLQQSADIFTFWRQLFSELDEGGEYRAQDFKEALSYIALGDVALKAINLITGRDRAAIRTELPDIITPLGIRLSTSETSLTAGQFTRAMLVPLLRDYCVPPHAYSVRWTGERYVVDLRSGGACEGPFSSNPSLVSVEGVDFFADPMGAYEAARVVCNAGRNLMLSTLEGAMVLAPCSMMMAPQYTTMEFLEPWAVKQVF